VKIWKYGRVKTTLEIDEDLHRRVKAHAALTGRKIKDLVAEGLRAILDAQPSGPLGLSLREEPIDREKAGALRELDALFREIDEIHRNATPGPNGLDLLFEDRARLDQWTNS
jgi:hypothetical protein